ncbi:hypothetical protein IEQ34_019428 [Dendrobium chrysotoxum]|uniref:Uncharacterized protein n=1 Tax=Dendrobium chrysotoxum TaxID=161865 RepID=A0AAV7FRE6_DENCH|nr:hypothetical protein IEQ34_019428 [Dendrobium chrysotoxum]
MREVQMLSYAFIAAIIACLGSRMSIQLAVALPLGGSLGLLTPTSEYAQKGAKLMN